MFSLEKQLAEEVGPITVSTKVSEFILANDYILWGLFYAHVFVLVGNHHLFCVAVKLFYGAA